MISQKYKDMLGAKSVIRQMSEWASGRAKEIGSENVFDFSLGNPNVPAPERVTRSFMHILEETEASLLHGYTSAPGDMSVRKAVSEYMNQTYNIGCEPTDFYMTAGAAASLTITLRSVCREGSQVIVFTPYFPEYKVFIENAGGVTVEVPVRREDFQHACSSSRRSLFE